MAGFLFIHSPKHADVVSKIVGALVVVVSLFAIEQLWETPLSSIVLVPLCFLVVGYKIFRRHSRTLALAIAVLLTSFGITLYLSDHSNPWLIVIWLSCGVAWYGFAATVAYRRLDGDNPNGSTHLEVLQKIKTILSVAINTSGCLLLALGVFSFVDNSIDKAKALYALALMPFFVMAFCEPFQDYLSHVFTVKHLTMTRKKWIARIGAFAFGILSTVLHQGLEQGITSAQWFTFALLLLLLLLPGQITGAWINGVSTGRSWWYGMTRGCILGLLSIALVWIITGNFRGTRQSPNFWVHLRSLAGETMSAAPVDGGIPDGSSQPSSAWFSLAAANAMIWGLFGLLGGIAIRFKRVVGGILFALLLAATLVEGTLVFFRLPFGDLVRFAVAQLCLVTGWILGVVLYPPARRLFRKKSDRSADEQIAEAH
jgi:uncharacterized protein (DUF486 family)